MAEQMNCARRRARDRVRVMIIMSCVDGRFSGAWKIVVECWKSNVRSSRKDLEVTADMSFQAIDFSHLAVLEPGNYKQID